MGAEKYSSGRRKQFTFRRWTRNPWGIFSSLGKAIRIGVLSVCFSLLVLPGKGQNMPDTIINNDGSAREIQLDEVVVSAQRSPVLNSELLRVVQVISRKEIEQAAPGNLADLLEFVRGVDIRQRGGQGMQSDISIRGGSFDQTMVLLNGVNLTDPQTGHHNLNLPVDINTIERIEVLKGPGARIFGPNAFNGAVNIITGDGAKKAINANISAGQYKTGDFSLSVSQPAGKTAHYLSIAGNTSAGYTNNTDYSNGNIFYRLRLPVSVMDIDVQAGYNSRAFGANSFYTPRFPDQFEATQTKFASLRIKYPEKVNLTFHSYWRRHNDRFELFRDSAPAWYGVHNYHMTDVMGGALNWTVVRKHSRNNLGVEYRLEHIYSNVLGNSLPEMVPVRGEDSAYFTKSYQRNGFSIFGEHSIWYGNFSLSGGLLAYVNQSLPNGMSLYPGLDAGYKISETLRLYSSVNRTLRLPTFTDLFYNSPTNEGNPGLKPEEAIMFEFGSAYNKGGFSADITFFKRWGRNMIDWVRQSNEDKWKSLNLTEVDIYGIETGVMYNWEKKNERPFLRTAGIHYTWYHTSKESKDFTSLYVLDNLKHKLDFTIAHRITKNSGMDWKISYQDRNGGYQPYEEGKYLSELQYKPVAVVDVKGYYNLKKWQFYITVSNLFDTMIVDHANVFQPGIWAKAGIKVLIPKKDA